MPNLFAAFKRLIPDAPLQYGEAVAVVGDTATVELPDGGRQQVLGQATVGQFVFFRDGRIEGQATELAPVVITL